MIKHVVATYLIIFIAALPTLGQEGIQPEDYYKTVFVSQTEISPDGSLLAFTRTTIVEDENKRHSEVWMQKLRNGRPMDLCSVLPLGAVMTTTLSASFV